MFQPQQDTASLPLPPAVRGRLLAAGFATAGSLRDVGVAVLAREAGLSHEEALAAVRLVPDAQGGRVGATEGTGAGSAIGAANAAAGSGPAAGGAGADGPPERTYVGIRGARSALEILAAEESRAHVLTFCGELDRLLGGGVPAGEVTEFCGVPGVGKTQLSMQLCLDVQIPVAFGGVGGRAVYIDTEGSFMVERIEQMARACVAHLQRMASVSRNPAMAAAAAGIDAHELLANIFYFRAHTATEQIAAINMLDSLAAEQQNVRLVVVDSIAFHFRQEYTDFARRTRVLNALAQQLLELAERRAVAVVLVNQVRGATLARALACIVLCRGS